MQQTMTKEKERHKAIVLYLQEEYDRLFAQMEEQHRQNSLTRTEWLNGHDKEEADDIDLLRQEAKLLREQLDMEKRQVLDLSRIVKKQEDELNSVRRMISMGQVQGDGTFSIIDIGRSREKNRFNGSAKNIEETSSNGKLLIFE